MRKLFSCASQEKAWYLINKLSAYVTEWRPAPPRFWVIIKDQSGSCEIWTALGSPILKQDERELKEVIQKAIKEWRTK